MCSMSPLMRRPQKENGRGTARDFLEVLLGIVA